MTQEKGIPYRRHKPSAVLREFLDPLDPGSYFDCGQARLHGLDDALLREAESRGRSIGDDSFQLVATDMGLIYCRPSISFAIAARWDEVTLIRPSGEDPVVLPINWPTHGELKFTVSKRLAGNVFRRWLQLQMQTERLERREKAERFSLKPNPGQSGGQAIEPPSPPAGAEGGGWEVVTEVDAGEVEPADPVMQAMPDRRGRGTVARQRKQNDAGKAKRRLRREGSAVSMPPGLADVARNLTSGGSQGGIAGVPKPVRPQPSNRRRTTELEPPASPTPKPDTAGIADKPAQPEPPRHEPASLGTRMGAEVTTHLPAPLSPPAPKQAEAPSPDIAQSTIPEQYPWPVAPKPIAEKRPELEQSPKPKQAPKPEQIPEPVKARRKAQSELVEPMENAASVDKADKPDKSRAGAFPSPDHPSLRLDRWGRRPAKPVTTQPSWIGSPVSIVGAMLVISTFVLITATATASYRRSVKVNDTIDPAGTELADPSAPVRTTIDHQRFNPADELVAVPLADAQDPAETSSEVEDSADSPAPAPAPAEDSGATSTTVPQESILQSAPRLCNSNYSGCVPEASDVDCPGDGDGPLYITEAAVVMGQDIYELDTDGDGETCEADQPLHSELSPGG